MKLDFLISTQFPQKNNQLKVDNLYITAKELENQIYYLSKQKQYKRLLKRCSDILNSHQRSIESVRYEFVDWSSSNVEFFVSQSEWSRLVEKEVVLTDLVALSDNIIAYSDNEFWKDEFSNVEVALQPYLDEYDLLLLNEQLQLYFCWELQQRLNCVYSQLRYIAKKKINFLKKDLRQSFRNIISFLFKNMDDELSENNVYENRFSKTLFNLINYSYEKIRNNTMSKEYT